MTHLPESFTLRVEPEGGVLGGPSERGNTICPLCGSIVRFCLNSGNGYCQLCGTRYTGQSVTVDKKLGELGSRLIRAEADYSGFTFNARISEESGRPFFGIDPERWDTEW